MSRPLLRCETGKRQVLWIVHFLICAPCIAGCGDKIKLGGCDDRWNDPKNRVERKRLLEHAKIGDSIKLGHGVTRDCILIANNKYWVGDFSQNENFGWITSSHVEVNKDWLYKQAVVKDGRVSE